MSNKIVYIAHPYTGPTIEDIRANIREAEEFGKQIALQGNIPIIPHNNTRLWEMDSRFENWAHKDWIERICLPILRRCDVVLFCGDWKQSQGCLRELEEAQALGLQVIIAEECEYVLRK